MRLNLDPLGFRKGFLIAFVVGFAVRLIPEILSYPYPIGWDPIYYAARINDGIVLNHWSNIFSTWMIYGILVSLGNLTRLEPFLLLKIVAPLLYGGTAAGIYFVAWKKTELECHEESIGLSATAMCLVEPWFVVCPSILYCNLMLLFLIL